MSTSFVGRSKDLTGFSAETGAPGGLEQRRRLSLWKCCSSCAEHRYNGKSGSRETR